MRTRRTRRWWWLALAPLLASAHVPELWRAGEPVPVTQPELSNAWYGLFEKGDEVFRLSLVLERDFALPVEVFVPHKAALAEHRPAWAIVGPGLPPPSAEELAALPLPLPAGAGAYVDLNRVSPRPVFYEFVTRRFFWSSGAMALALPRGAHELWVWSPGRTAGRFGLGFGVEEGGDYMKAFANWSDFAY